MKRKEITKKQELLISIGIAVLFVIGTILISGTFFTGFHFIDDHEFVEVGQTIREQGLISTIISCMRSDLTIRFRPLYWFLRVVGVWTFGLHWQLWYLVKAAEIIISMVCFYWLARRLNCKWYVSAMFTLLIFCGPQTEVWCRLGPQEGLGILLLSVLLLVETLPYSRKRSGMMMLLIFLMSGAKEAFLLLMPAVCFFAVWYQLWKSESDFSLKEIWMEIRRNGIFILFSAVLCVLELLIIVFVVGTHDLSYAGFTPDMSWKDYIWKLQGFLREDRIKYYYLLTGAALIFGAVGAGFHKWKTEGRKYIYAFLMLAYAAASQIVLYIRSGMVSRYYIPWIVAVSAIVCIFCIHLSGHNRIVSKVQLLIAAGFCLLAISWMKAPLDKFVELGKSTEFVIETVKELYQDGERIMTELGGGELDASLRSWLTIEEKIMDVRGFDEQTAADMDMIVTVNDEGKTASEFTEYGLDPKDYNRYAWGRYAVYEKLERKTDEKND